MSRTPNRKRIALVVAGIASASALAALSLTGNLSINPDFGQPVDDSSPQAVASVTSPDRAAVYRGGKGANNAALTQTDDRPKLHVVVFRDAPLASYEGGVSGIAKPERKGNGRGAIKANGKSARTYVGYLEGKQKGYERRIGQALGKQLKVHRRMQHALNAVVTTISPLEAEAISALPEVLFVQENYDVPMDTDTGPALIGATNVWQGIDNPISGSGQAMGEGVVVGIIDSGINFGSPSFAAVDPVDGYSHVNPNGSGNYLGTCAPGGVDEGRCNDKLIGGYDFICGPTAPADACAFPTLYRDEPGFGDSDGHGSHTASTAAGNQRNEVYNYSEVSISGVAPRANIIAYDVCYHTLSDGLGRCPFVSSIAAVDQAIINEVDVINFSIGGGSDPWNDAVSLAFLNATNAGVFVSASAGNSGPGAGTLGHVEPWTIASAAAQHGRAAYGMGFSVTAPTQPANLQNVELTPGVNGVSAIPMSDTPVVLSPDFTGGTDGCNAGDYPEGTFEGAVAVVRRGGCSFSIKVNAADAAGATAVIIANNAAGNLLPSVPGTSIPAYAMTQANGDTFAAYAADNTGITADIAPLVINNVADALGSFSSRGPSGFDLLKPDITSPGVAILAAYAGDTISGFENLIEIISGTSMASPHTAGAAALLRQMHPDWTVAEIKSALQMTANQSVLLEDQTTPANWHAGGAGRTQVDRAARAGLVLDETYDRYLAANPETGGDPAGLNLATMAAMSCEVTCTFVRTVRSTVSNRQQWRLRLQGVQGTVEPASLTLKPGQSRQVLITIDATTLPQDGNYNYAAVSIEPSNARFSDMTLPALHMPIAIRVPPPPPPTTPLDNGVSVTVAGDTDSQTHFTFEVPAGAGPVTFSITGGAAATGDADLYVRFGDYATLADFDCRPYLIGNEETCTEDPQAGTYYVMVHAYPFDGPIADITLTASY